MKKTPLQSDPSVFCYWRVFAVALLLAIAGASFSACRSPSAPQTVVEIADANSNAMCDAGMSNVKTQSMGIAGNAVPPVIDSAPAPGPAPDGMVWIPAGEFSMGSDEPMFGDAKPIHRVKLHGYWMDKTEVT